LTQNAKVLKLLDHQKALVVVERMSACGENCAHCASGCSSKNKSTVIAANNISAHAGDEVIIKTKTSKILTAAFIVYIVPVFLFIIAYMVTDSLNLSSRSSILISIAAFMLGGAGAFAYNKYQSKKQGIEFEISSFVK
jgi:sigma-E factor negative regulatory protein RseC